MDQESVNATVTVAVPPAGAFAVLADPVTHPVIDGTGWVQEPLDRAPLTEVGQVFRMDMYHPDAEHGDYQVSNKVHVLDAPRAIGWLTGYDPQGDGYLEFGGWFWRYDLVPLGLSETEVTLTYDWSGVPPSVREYIQFPPFGPEHLTNSLQHLAALASDRSIQVSRIIDAPPERVFDLLADPGRHRDLDETGMIQRSQRDTRSSTGSHPTGPSGPWSARPTTGRRR